MQTVKTIRFGRCPGCPESLLGSHVVLLGCNLKLYDASCLGKSYILFVLFVCILLIY